MKIYMAGKIAKGDWRHSLVDGLTGAISLNDGVFQEDWPVLEKSITVDGQAHDYVGPFFIADDHGCAHGQNSHGCVGPPGGSSCIDDVAGFNPHDCGNGSQEVRSWIVKQCVRAIAECDLFFAWIEDATAYGTLVEIGMARAVGKIVYTNGPYNLPEDLWFAFSASSACGRFGDPKSALDQSIRGASIALRVHDARGRFVNALERCESPIERMFLSAFAENPNTRAPTGPAILDIQISDHNLAHLHQQMIPNGLPYRLDFVVTTKVARIAVELDGHDFHERTKEQAERDKRRDRELTAAGWRVLRFTGSEVYRNAAACVAETIKVAGAI